MNESMPRGAPAPPGVDATRHVVETGEEFDVLNWFVRFWWPNRWMVLGSTSVVLVLAAAVASMLPDAYDATASVLVTPSALSAKVGSAPVDLNVYARMAKSGAIIDGAVAEARRMNALGGPEEPQDFRVDVGSQSMLGLSVTARQAAAAGAFANAWAQVFVTKTVDDLRKSRQAALSVILRELPTASADLRDKQAGLQRITDEGDRTLRELRLKLEIDLKTQELADQTATLLQLERTLREKQASVTATRGEADRIQMKLESGAPPSGPRPSQGTSDPSTAQALESASLQAELQKQELAVETAALLDVERSLLSAQLTNASAGDEIEAIRAELEATPQSLVTRQSRASDGQSAAPVAAEPTNPIFIELSRRLATSRLDQRVGALRSAALEREVKNRRDRILGLQASVKRIELSERLASARTDQQGSASQTAALEREIQQQRDRIRLLSTEIDQSASAVSTLQRRVAADTDRATREVNAAKVRFDLLSSQAPQPEVAAAADANPELQVAALARPSLVPTHRSQIVAGLTFTAFCLASFAVSFVLRRRSAAAD